MAPLPHTNIGGWKTFPFVIGGLMGITITEKAVISNLVVYLIQQYNMKSIDATQVSNFITGCVSILPIFGAILADASFGCFTVAALGSASCLLGMLILILTSTISSLRPPSCILSPCQAPTSTQLLVLYIALTLMGLGIGGTKYNLATLGASQFEDPSQQATFFNWFFATGIYASSIIGQLGIIYVEDNVGWEWGYSLCGFLVVTSFVVLFTGKRYYRLDKPHESNPYLSLLNVVVSIFLRRKALKTCDGYVGHYYKLENGENMLPISSEGLNNNLENPNEVNSFTKYSEIEDFKAILHVLPIIITNLLVSTSVGIIISFSVLEALAMDRNITSYFTLSAGSVTVLIIFSSSISIMFLDRKVYPIWRRIVGESPSHLTRVGIGNSLIIATLVCAALVEQMRLRTTQTDTKVSVLWLLPPLAMTGLTEAFHVPGLVSFYNQEFPETLRSMATGLLALTIGLGQYFTLGSIKIFKSLTSWIKDDANDSRLDNIYWVWVVILGINLVCYLVCAKLFKHRNVQLQ